MEGGTTRDCYTHLKYEETEAQRKEMTCSNEWKSSHYSPGFFSLRVSYLLPVFLEPLLLLPQYHPGPKTNTIPRPGRRANSTLGSVQSLALSQRLLMDSNTDRSPGKGSSWPWTAQPPLPTLNTVGPTTKTKTLTENTLARRHWH